MPSPAASQTDSLSSSLLQAFDKVNGLHPGFRPAHAKGMLVSGTFVPAASARTLTTAPHVHTASTPVVVRFSDSSGIPNIPDNDPKAVPHGIAIRFQLAEHVHTDIIGHTVDAFPTRTAEEFLEFLQAISASGPGVSSPTPVEQFLGAHPAALRFVQLAGEPVPASFFDQTFYSVTAHKFTSADGVTRFGRYRIAPVTESISGASPSSDPDFLFHDLAQRLSAGPQRMRIVLQIAGEGDIVDDATARWPDERSVVDFGAIDLTALVPDDEAEQKHIIFDPIPRVEGIEPSADPLLEPRAAVYLMSGRRRRAAGRS